MFVTIIQHDDGGYAIGQFAAIGRDRFGTPIRDARELDTLTQDRLGKEEDLGMQIRSSSARVA